MAQIYKKQGSWAVRVYFDENGKRKSKNKQGFRTKKEAEIYAADLETKKNTSGISSQLDISFADYLSEWINTYKVGKYAKNTEDRYKRTALLIHDYFGNSKLKNISRQQYQRFLDQYASKHAKNTVTRVNSVVRACVTDAMDDRIIFSDFTRHAHISGLESKASDLKFLQLAEIRKIKEIAAFKASIKAIAYYEILFAIDTGARYGEIAGMTWDCVNFVDNEITICKSYDYINRTGFKATKNKQSIRTISISPFLSTMLRKLKKEQAEYFLSHGYKNDLNLVFISYKRSVPSSNGANKVLRSILADINAVNQNVGMHGLRHTHASILINKGILIDYVSERLGHSNVAVTISVYRHLLESKRIEESKRAINILSAL
ncbi:tyrosine-type recombinase/integrase [Latilactobacillus sakei]